MAITKITSFPSLHSDQGPGIIPAEPEFENCLIDLINCETNYKSCKNVLKRPSNTGSMWNTRVPSHVTTHWSLALIDNKQLLRPRMKAMPGSICTFFCELIANLLTSAYPKPLMKRQTFRPSSPYQPCKQMSCFFPVWQWPLTKTGEC